jgi:hypothetical protein
MILLGNIVRDLQPWGEPHPPRLRPRATATEPPPQPPTNPAPGPPGPPHRRGHPNRKEHQTGQPQPPREGQGRPRTGPRPTEAPRGRGSRQQPRRTGTSGEGHPTAPRSGHRLHTGRRPSRKRPSPRKPHRKHLEARGRHRSTHHGINPRCTTDQDGSPRRNPRQGNPHRRHRLSPRRPGTRKTDTTERRQPKSHNSQAQRNGLDCRPMAVLETGM